MSTNMLVDNTTESTVDDNLENLSLDHWIDCQISQPPLRQLLDIPETEEQVDDSLIKEICKHNQGYLNLLKLLENNTSEKNQSYTYDLDEESTIELPVVNEEEFEHACKMDQREI